MEADPQYVRFVGEVLGKVVDEPGSSVARRVVAAPTWLELEQRINAVSEVLREACSTA